MENRKKDHIDLALQSQISMHEKDDRFYYEPLLSGHPTEGLQPIQFLGKTMKAPLWISSMTGGAELAGKINMNLAKACREFGLGMGLGSTRIFMEEGIHRSHFDLREIIGDDAPFYVNLGIPQIEKALQNKSTDKIEKLIIDLKADGLIIHVNPLQEWLQPEGDLISKPPIDTIEHFLQKAPQIKIIIKEVGQGFGPKSLHRLLKLPIEAIEYGAFGGTNFAKVELLRNSRANQKLYDPLSYIGNDAFEMTEWINEIFLYEQGIKCKGLIISGGIKSFLDGYYLMQKSNLPAIYGQASAFLNYAREDYETLKGYIESQIKGLELAFAYLTLK